MAEDDAGDFDGPQRGRIHRQEIDHIGGVEPEQLPARPEWIGQSDKGFLAALDKIGQVVGEDIADHDRDQAVGKPAG